MENQSIYAMIGVKGNKCVMRTLFGMTLQCEWSFSSIKEKKMKKNQISKFHITRCELGLYFA